MKRLLFTIWLTVCLTVSMLAQTTRFYFSSSTTASVSPAFASWTVTTGADRYVMSTTKDGSTLTNKTSAASGAAASRNILVRQYVSGQIGACTLSSANITKIQVRGRYNGTATRIELYIYVRVVSADGSTFRGTFLSADGFSSDQYTTTLRNTGGGTFGGSDVVAQDGDRIVVDIGWRYFTGSSTTVTVTNDFGSSSGTDLSEDNTSTSANNPWIEFGQTIPAPSGGGGSTNRGMPLNMLNN